MRWPFTRKTHWEDMDDLTWLDYVIRNVHRVRSNGESEDEDMLICDVALHGYFTVTIKANSLEELIRIGHEFERDRLRMPNRKWRWRGAHWWHYNKMNPWRWLRKRRLHG